MPTKSYRPVTPVLRYKKAEDFGRISTDTAHKPLLRSKKQSGGRNSSGRTTVRYRGGGHKRHYRIIDFKRNKDGIPGVVETIEYDPNRTCHIALVKYVDGEKRYVLATTRTAVGDRIVSGERCEAADGNCMQLQHIPAGTMVHNVELVEGKGGRIVRSAGAYAEILAKENRMVQLKLPSSEVRAVRETCRATIGQVSNPEHMNVDLGSAGRKRWLGRRPHVRGVAMNPVDHPMGGGEGKSAGGRQPVSPWGQKAKGQKTRKKRKASSKHIIRQRVRKKKKKQKSG
ncbi:MAG: 50S ribosomal protein L2 [Chitinivibrionales bacterium]|nr:50S ribosomal protein L2 [Chitinivibrionales bacterium]MBD3396946.1 50S ribosomal protein L2 [Chitinivibrionales bacterium]